MSAQKRVVVVGAGIVGLSCAYFLRMRDLEVVVLDAEPIGSDRAASFANGGLICPAQAGPLPESGLTIYGLRALLNADSALYFQPAYMPRLLPWLAHFYRYCNQRDFDAGSAALAALGERSFAIVDQWVDDGIAFELYKRGLLCATADESAARKVLRSLDGMRGHGYELPDELLLGDALHELEPALSPRVRAGFCIEQSWHVRPQTLIDGLGRWLRAAGVEFREGAKLVGFDAADRRVRAVRTSEGELSADAFVLAAGAWTQPLARKLGVRFPMQPGKGYTFLIKPKLMPSRTILFSDIHAGATPLGDHVRIGGTMEFSGYNITLDRRRIDTIFGLARQYIELEQPDYEQPWAGLRPLTPDGLPVIDWAQPFTNAYIATGHSMLGMTLGPPTGEALTEMILTETRPAQLDPFRVDRFRQYLGRKRATAASV